LEGGGMFAVKNATELPKGARELVAPPEPGPVDSVAGPINIATPDPFQAVKQAAILARSFFQGVGKRDRRRAGNADHRPEIPFRLRPIRREKRHLPARFHQARGEPFQVGFRPATRRKAAPDDSYGKFAARRHGLFTWMGTPQYLLTDGG